MTSTSAVMVFPYVLITLPIAILVALIQLRKFRIAGSAQADLEARLPHSVGFPTAILTTTRQQIDTLRAIQGQPPMPHFTFTFMIVIADATALAIWASGSSPTLVLTVPGDQVRGLTAGMIKQGLLNAHTASFTIVHQGFSYQLDLPIMKAPSKAANARTAATLIDRIRGGN